MLPLSLLSLRAACKAYMLPRDAVRSPASLQGYLGRHVAQKDVPLSNGDHEQVAATGSINNHCAEHLFSAHANLNGRLIEHR